MEEERKIKGVEILSSLLARSFRFEAEDSQRDFFFPPLFFWA